jgi:hypothetical protein
VLYYYRVKPTNGDASTYSAVITGATVLRAPSGVSGTRVANGINLSWTRNSTVSTGVSIDRSTDGLSWTNIANLTTTATSYSDVIPGYSSTQMYYYRVRNTAGSTYSSYASWNTTLSAATNFTAAQVTPTTITFTWSMPVTGASGAWIDQNTGGSWSRVSPTSLQATPSTWTLTGLTPNTSYTFRLRLSSYADSVFSGYTGNLSVTTPWQTVWYKANESSGTTLRDSFTSAKNGTLSGSYSFGAGVSGNALTLSGGSASLPAGIVSGLNNFTLATWVRVSSFADGARIFDFGTGTTNTMYLTAQAPGTTRLPRFVITTSSGTQQIDSSIALTANTWTHIAITLSGNSATMYINGAVAGTNAAMTLRPDGLGSTTQNYLGRSQGAEPNFLGSLDDFQIHGRAFSAAEVQTLATPSTLLAWYKADETLGVLLNDASGLGNYALLSGAYGFGTGLAGNAVALSGGWGNLPTGIVGGLNDFTIATWVRLTSVDTWSRIFDFGTGTSNYMFLTPRAGGTNLPRFAITTGSGEQVINSNTAIAANTWTHVAVTLSGNTGTLYLNGAVVGTNTNMTLRPASLNATTQNYLGDSQFTADPSLQGSLDDFRLYSRAFSATEVRALVYPTIATPAAASNITTTTATLSALGADVTFGEPALTYTWSVTGTPPAPVTFSANGTNAAKNTTVTFTKSGTYNFLLTVANPAGYTATSTVAVTIYGSATMVARRTFYGGSVFDSSTHENAIASDKLALLPGQTATFANYTSYVRGINGIMVDILNPGGALTAADFTFRAGNTLTPSTWPAAPAPVSVVNRPGAGAGGSTRVEIIWADYAIRNKWLQVTVKAGANTGLGEDDVFYFGNAAGESGNNPANTYVDGSDMTAARDNPGAAGITHPYDYNRDGLINTTDMAIARDNFSNYATALVRLAAPISGQAGGEPAAATAGAQINIGTQQILANTPNQKIYLFVTGGELVTGFNLRAQLTGGSPAPVLQGVTFGGGIWAGQPLMVAGGGVVTQPQLAQASAVLVTAGNAVAAEGLLATLTVDTTGVAAGNTFSLLLGGTAIGQDSDFTLTGVTTIAPALTVGTIELVDPAAPLVLSGGSATIGMTSVGTMQFTQGGVTKTRPVGSFSAVQITGGPGDDIFAIDLSGTNPFGAAPVMLNGAGQVLGDNLVIQGPPGNNIITAQAAQVAVAGTPFSYTALAGVTLNLGPGDDTLNITGPLGAKLTFNNGPGVNTVNLVAGTQTFDTDLGAYGPTSLAVADAASATLVAGQSLAGLTIAANGTVALARGSGVSVRTPALTIGGSGATLGRLDLTDGSLILTYGGASPYDTLRALTLTGRLTGRGLLASTPAGAPAGAVGLIDNNMIRQTVWRGITIADGLLFNQMILQGGLAGDGNLDGLVNKSDYLNVFAHMGRTGVSFLEGDLNADGVVNLDDLALVTAALGAGAAGGGQGALTQAIVPPIPKSVAPPPVAKAPAKPAPKAKLPAPTGKALRPGHSPSGLMVRGK